MSYHKITVIGHVGSAPELQVTPTGKEVAVCPLYVNERYGNEERAVRYKVKAWSDLASVVMEHLVKGQLLLVEGTPSVNVWRGANGEPHSQLIVTADTLRFLGAKPTSANREREEES